MTQIAHIHDAATGETIEREMTDAEKAQQAADDAESNAMKAARATKEATRLAAIAKLGLTADEIAALFG